MIQEEEEEEEEEKEACNYGQSGVRGACDARLTGRAGTTCRATWG